MLKNKLTEKIKDCAIYSTGEGTNSYLLSDEQAEQILHTVIDEIKRKLPKEEKRCQLLYRSGRNCYRSEVLTLLNQMKGEK